MTLNGNGGKIYTRFKCNIKNLDQEVWYNGKYITNVMSLSMIARYYHVTYDSSKDKAFIIHRPGKPNLRFESHSSGFHLLRTTKTMFFVQTLEYRIEGYSKREVSTSRKANILHASVGYPILEDFKLMICKISFLITPSQKMTFVLQKKILVLVWHAVKVSRLERDPTRL